MISLEHGSNITDRVTPIPRSILLMLFQIAELHTLDRFERPNSGKLTELRESLLILGRSRFGSTG